MLYLLKSWIFGAVQEPISSFNRRFHHLSWKVSEQSQYSLFPDHSGFQPDIAGSLRFAIYANLVLLQCFVVSGIFIDLGCLTIAIPAGKGAQWPRRDTILE